MKNLGKNTLLNDTYEPQGGCNCGVLCGASCNCKCSKKNANVITCLRKGTKNVPASKYRTPGEFPS